MGAVYKARQKQLDRIVALKILPPNVSHDPAFADRFAREAKAIVEGPEHRGTLVYSGGDDVLAFLPVDTCLACAAGLHGKFAELLIKE